MKRAIQNLQSWPYQYRKKNIIHLLKTRNWNQNLTGGNEAEGETQEQENQQQDNNGMKQLPMLLTHVLPSFSQPILLTPLLNVM